MRHAQARNIVERVFGVFKRRFKILTTAPEYPFETQAQIVQALCVVHNFIRIHDPLESMDIDIEEDESVGSSGGLNDESDLGGTVSRQEREAACDLRDQIAEAMWEGYQAYKRSRNALELV